MTEPGLIRTELAAVARAEALRLHNMNIGDIALQQRIAFYYTSLDLAPPSTFAGLHYSAVFISWCMRSAGASKTDFPATDAHWQYAQRALNGDPSGLLNARPAAEYPPRTGDLVHFNRGDRRSMETATKGRYRSESAILADVRQTNAEIVIGNNAAGTVGSYLITLDRRGLIADWPFAPIICIIEVLK